MMAYNWLILLAATKNVWLEKRLKMFDLEVKNFDSTGRGLATIRDRKPGEVVMEVDDTLTSDKMLKRFKSIHSTVTAAPNLLSDEQILSLGILEMKNENNEYILTLPEKQHSILTLPASLEQCLPQCYQRSVQAFQETARMLYMQLSSSSKLPLSLDDFLWAFSTVRSRSILAPEFEMNPLLKYGSAVRILLPAFDLLNHKTGAQCYVEFLKNSGGKDIWRLSSKEAFRAGDQVFLSYGDLDNLKLLYTYGFCLRDNPNNLVFFDLEDLLQASTIARPNVLPEHLLTKLKPQIEAAVGSSKGENRAMFSYDGIVPRDSLVFGLNIMRQVAQKLYGKEDKNLMDDILSCLKDIRSQEVREALKNLISVVDIPEEWNATRDFIRILLEAEKELLAKSD